MPDGGNGAHSELDVKFATLALVAHKLTSALAGLNQLATDETLPPPERAKVHRDIAALMEECKTDLEHVWPLPSRP